jgi:hypothetical protein
MGEGESEERFGEAKRVELSSGVWLAIGGGVSESGIRRVQDGGDTASMA